MSKGIWDAMEVTVCPHGNFLNTGDVGPCGCQVKIKMKDGEIISAGPYDFPYPNESWRQETSKEKP